MSRLVSVVGVVWKLPWRKKLWACRFVLGGGGLGLVVGLVLLTGVGVLQRPDDYAARAVVSYRERALVDWYRAARSSEVWNVPGPDGAYRIGCVSAGALLEAADVVTAPGWVPVISGSWFGWMRRSDLDGPWHAGSLGRSEYPLASCS